MSKVNKNITVEAKLINAPTNNSPCLQHTIINRNAYIFQLYRIIVIASPATI